ncbi:MAG TPA: hypothetical protein VFA60_07600 [Terriglobales bacterium]|nr:hypothetical protein [Terriglobales bacterium]
MNNNPSATVPSAGGQRPAWELDRHADALRLTWSRWSRCESSFSLLLVPPRPGVFVLAQEVAVLSEGLGSDGRGSDAQRSAAERQKKMLAIFYLAQAEDLGRAVSRLFAATSPLRDRLAAANCYVRFAVIEDAAQRLAVTSALGRWFSGAAAASVNDTATGPAAAAQASTEQQAPLGYDLLLDCDPGDEQPASQGAHAPPAAAPREQGRPMRRPAPFPYGF